MKHIRLALVCFTLLFACLPGQPGEAYLRTSDNSVGARVFVRWTQLPIRYSVTDRGVAGVTSVQLQAAVQRATQSWQTLPNSTIAFQFGGLTSALPLNEDGQNTIGFLNRPEFVGLLGSAVVIFDVVTGAIVESDAFLNSAYDWSVAERGEVERYDVESVALHEIGHIIGLSHSGLGEMQSGNLVAAEAAMFPYFNPGTIISRTLKADDVAGTAEIYPDGGHRDNTGSIAGRVRLRDRGAFGAHVIAFNPITGALIAGFALENGEFVISGLARGPHIIRVEPIDDGAPGDYLDEPPAIEVNFTTLFVQRLVNVERGAVTSRLDIAVESK